MKAEQQYIDLFTHYEDLICRHAAGLMNLPRAEALADLERLGFPTVIVLISRSIRTTCFVVMSPT